MRHEVRSSEKPPLLSQLLPLVLLLATLSPRSAPAQSEVGYVWMMNRIFGRLDAPILDEDGVTPLDGEDGLANTFGGRYRVVLWTGPAPEQMTGLSFDNLGRGSKAGYLFSPHLLTIAVPAGRTAYCRLEVWDASAGEDLHWARVRGGASGSSAVFQIIAGTQAAPAILEGLKSFRIERPGLGTVRFENFVAGVVEGRAFHTDGRTPLEGFRYLAQLQSRSHNSPFEDSFVSAGAPVPFGTGAGAGYWLPGADPTRTLPNVGAGQVADLRILVWDGSQSATFEGAARAGASLGVSPIFPVTAGHVTRPDAPPAPLIGLRPFFLSPSVAGTVDFRGLGPGTISRQPVRYFSTVSFKTIFLEPPWVAQLFVGRSSSDLVPVGTPAPFGRDSSAGYWIPPGNGIVTLRDFLAGEQVWAEVRVWNSQQAATYTEAITKAPHGRTTAFPLQLGGLRELPAPLIPDRYISVQDPHFTSVVFKAPQPVRDATGQPLAGPNYVAQLYDVPLSSFIGEPTPLGSPAPFGTGAAAGYWQAADPIVNIEIPVGCCANVEVRIWDRTKGDTYEAAAGSPRARSRTVFLFPTSGAARALEADRLGPLVVTSQSWPAVRMDPRFQTQVLGPDGNGTGLDRPGFVAQLHVLTGSDSRSSDAFARGLGGLAMGPIRAVGTGTRAGRWEINPDEAIELVGTERDMSVLVQLRAWESARGPTFEESVRNGGEFGFSEYLTLQVTSDFLSTPRAVGLPAFPLRGRRFLIALEPGLNLVANPAATGPIALLPHVLPNPPTGTLLYRFDASRQTYQASTFFEAWDSPLASELPPGTGFFVSNPSRRTLSMAFDGWPGGLPALTRPSGKPAFHTRANTREVVASFEQLTGLVPVDGDSLYTLELGRWQVRTFAFGAWDSSPELAPGRTAFVRLVPAP